MDTTALGVIIGRFQTPELHEGHRHLIDTAISRSDAILILIGVSGGFPSARDPLPFEVREAMLREYCPDAIIRPLADHPSNESWSASVDRVIAEIDPDAGAFLYGSRNSFIGSYSGKHLIIVVPGLGHHNATMLRDEIGTSVLPGRDFRAGLISAQYARGPISYQAVDIAVIQHGSQNVLVGRKPIDDGVRFIGGFVDPEDSSLERAALRELSEEAGSSMNLHELHYLGSYRIPDHRYRGSPDQVMTALFGGYHLSGAPRAGDDIESVEWVPFRKLASSVVTSHRPLAERVIRFIENGR